MIYPSVRRGQFLTRPNRFIAHVELDGAPVVCHVKDVYKRQGYHGFVECMAQSAG